MQLVKAFHAHPAAVGQTYVQHMGFALRFGLRLLGAGAAAVVHALIPFWFQTTASRAVKALHELLDARRVDSATPLAAVQTRCLLIRQESALGAARVGWPARIRKGWERHLAAEPTHRALNALDARTLKDIGIDRSEIGSITAEVIGTADRTRIRAH